MKINHNLTESDLDKIDVRSPLKYRIQQPEMKNSGWRFDKIDSMTLYFHKTGELNGSKYVKIPLRLNAILNIENNDNYCSLWSILANLHHCNTNHNNRITDYKQHFGELNIERFDFTKGIKCSYIHLLKGIITLSTNIIELMFYQDQNKWKHE